MRTSSGASRVLLTAAIVVVMAVAVLRATADHEQTYNEDEGIVAPLFVYVLLCVCVWL